MQKLPTDTQEMNWEDEAKRYCQNALYWNERADKAEAREDELNGILENLEVQALNDIAEGWVSIPEVEWDSNIEMWKNYLRTRKK